MFKLNAENTYANKVGTGEWHKVDTSSEYLAWLSEGNTPEPADLPAPLTKDQRKDALITAAGAKDVLSVWGFIIAVEAKYPTMTTEQLYATGNIAYCKCVDLKNAIDAIDAEP